MKQYPKIPSKIDGGSEASFVRKFWVFDKIDGSNIRVEWSSKRGFYKFGTRKRLIDHTDEVFGKVEKLAREIEPKFSAKFKELKIDRAICFFEFYGPNSFAGWHDMTDEHKLSLIDIHVDRKGILEPDEFCNFVEDTDIEHPKVLHIGTVSHEIIQKVQEGTLPGMSFEGVVCKARHTRKWSEPIMYKIKNKKWVEKVRALYNDPKVLEDLL